MSRCLAVFKPTGGFNLAGMKAAAEDTVVVNCMITQDAKCPASNNPALQPRVSVVRRNCDGSVRRCAAPKALQVTTAVCSSGGVFKAEVTAPFINVDKCFGIVIQLADGTDRMSIVQYA
jgi:hypothetical protein